MYDLTNCRALTFRQPWLVPILDGRKTCENRGWCTPWRGTLLLHAGKSMDEVKRLPDGTLPPITCTQSAIVGLANLIDCVGYGSQAGRKYNLESDCWAFGEYCWILEDAQPLPYAFPCPGKLGLWKPSLEMLADIRGQIARHPQLVTSLATH